MTIEEIIAKEKEIAQDFQKTIDTHMVSENTSLEEMYCDDTEVIKEHLQRCKVFADYHNQVANIMRKYQKMQAEEQEPVLDKIGTEIRKKMKFNSFNEGYVLYDDITEVFDKYKAESEE